MDYPTSLVYFKHSFTTPKGSFELLPLTKDNLQDVINLEVDAFINRDPSVIASGGPEASFRKLAELVAQRALEDGLGIVCVYLSNGKVVGAALSNDYYRSLVNPVDFSAIYGGIRDLLFLPDNISVTDVLNAKEINDAIDLFLLGVDAEYAKQGIATEMLRYLTEEHPVASKANDVFTHCTSPLTYKITAKMNWQKLDVVDPRPYTNKDGVRIFEKVDEITENLGLPAYEGVIIMHKKLK